MLPTLDSLGVCELGVFSFLFLSSIPPITLRHPFPVHARNPDPASHSKLFYRSRGTRGLSSRTATAMHETSTPSPPRPPPLSSTAVSVDCAIYIAQSYTAADVVVSTNKWQIFAACRTSIIGILLKTGGGTSVRCSMHRSKRGGTDFNPLR